MTGLAVMAQDHMPNRVNTYSDEEPETGFKKENLFLGGGLRLGVSSFNFTIGVNPEIGYSLNRWLDVGVVTNFNYSSVQADPSGYYNPNVSSREFIYGGGVFGEGIFFTLSFRDRATGVQLDEYHTAETRPMEGRIS